MKLNLFKKSSSIKSIKRIFEKNLRIHYEEISVMAQLWEIIKNTNILIKKMDIQTKHELLKKIVLSKHAFEQVLKHEQDPYALRQWLYSELIRRKPCWDSAFNSPIRSAWMSRLFQQQKFFKDEKEGMEPVQVCGFTISSYLPYDFKTNKQVAIWFSTDPKIALRPKEKEALIKRSFYSQGNEVLIYSSLLLEETAKNELLDFAKQYKIKLIDIDFLPVQLSPPSQRLLEKAKLELNYLNKGGNPAAASDLIRWIPELMMGSVYADIDLPIDPRKIHSNKSSGTSFKAGLPVVLNMGSIQKSTNKKRVVETCSINTDIMAYSTHPNTHLFMERVGSFLLDAHDDPFTALINAATFSNAKIKISQTAAFKALQARNNANIFDLRLVISNCNNLKHFYELLGPELFRESFNTIFTPYTMELIITNCSDNLPIPNKLLLVAQPKLTHKMNSLKQSFYKDLVMEITGPGAIYTAFGGKKTFLDVVHQPHLNIPISKPRVWEGYACVNGVTAFTSDNIPSWRTSKKQFDQTVYNTDGLSWMPSF